MSNILTEAQIISAIERILKVGRREAKEIYDNPLGEIPGNDGQWLQDGIYQNDRGLWFTLDYLSSSFKDKNGRPIVERSRWYAWKDGVCSELDPTVNHGSIRFLDVFWPLTPEHTRPVFFQPDVKQIVARITNPEARKTPPGRNGEWLTGDIYQDTDGMLYFRAKVAAKRCKVSSTSLTEWRRHVQSALDQNVNGGKLRFIKIPPLKRPGGGRMKVVVYHQDDMDTIVKWRERIQTIEGRVPSGWQRTADIIGEYNCSAGKQKLLGVVLCRFRVERPQSWVGVDILDSRNIVRHHFFYDPFALHEWIDDRDIVELAKTIRRQHRSRPEIPVLRTRLEKAVRFLIRELRHGDWQDSRLIADKAKEAHKISIHDLRPAANVMQLKVKKTLRKPDAWRLPDLLSQPVLDLIGKVDELPLIRGKPAVHAFGVSPKAEGPRPTVTLSRLQAEAVRLLEQSNGNCEAAGRIAKVSGIAILYRFRRACKALGKDADDELSNLRQRTGALPFALQPPNGSTTNGNTASAVPTTDATGTTPAKVKKPRRGRRKGTRVKKVQERYRKIQQAAEREPNRSALARMFTTSRRTVDRALDGP